MKKIISIVLSIVMVLSMAVPVAFAEEAVFIFVAPDGDDSAAGTKDAPLATIKAARDRARANSGTTVINMRGGTYRISETFELGEKDKNLVIRAYNGEDVILTGASVLDNSAFGKLSDDDKKRIIERNAADKVYVADLKDMGITEYGKLERFDHLMYGAQAPAVYYNGSMLTLARYPNDGYLTIDEVVDPGSAYLAIYKGDDTTTDPSTCVPFKIRTNDSRVSRYTQANDPWIWGSFRYDWAAGQYGVDIDFENKNTLTAKDLSAYGAAQGQRFYFFNLLEEIDSPGEYYLDRETGKLYIYPLKDADINTAKIEFANFSGSFFDISETENITILGLTMEMCIGKSVNIKNAKNIHINDCEFRNISDTVINGSGVSDSIIENSHIHDVGVKAIVISGGDYETLTPANIKIQNNHIENVGLIDETGSNAIEINGVGLTVAHNKINHTPHHAIAYFGNYIVLEYNDISDACYNSSDSGVIYTGRRWTNRGNEIRYNYIHDIKLNVGSSGGVHAVYLDDCHSSTAVYGNVFYKVSSVALYGGGRYNTFTDNIMLECDTPFKMDARCASGTEQWNNMIVTLTNYVNSERPYYNTGVWAEKFPEMKGLMEDEPNIPKYNVLKRNVIYKTEDLSTAEAVRENSTVEASLDLVDTKAFENYNRKDFTVKKDSIIFEKYPEFDAPDFNKIGLYEYTVEDVYTEVKGTFSGGVVLQIDNPNALSFGIKTKVDSANDKVSPVIIDSRTLVPVRFIAEAFGSEVGWDDATKTVTVGDSISLKIGDKKLICGDAVTELDVPAQIIEERTMLPLRAVVEALGKSVHWDDANRLIIITDSAIEVSEALAGELAVTLK